MPGEKSALRRRKERAINAGASSVDIYCADVANYDDLNDAAQDFFHKRGGVDVWINNAMASVFSEFKNIEPEEYRRVTEVVYLGSVWGAKIALEQMEKQQRGRIVFVGSALAYRGIPLQSAYCGGKHAIQGLCDSLRAELLHNNSPVSVGMAQLPAVNTPQFNWARNKTGKDAMPVPPIFQPEVIAEGLYWFSQRKKRELFIAWPAIKTIYGNKLLPKLGDWYLAKTGYKSQFAEKNIFRPKGDNLFSPVKGDFGAHGSFDDKAISKSKALFLTERKKSAAIIGAGLFAFLFAFLKRRKHRAS